jgi:hypothetical protein
MHELARKVTLMCVGYYLSIYQDLEIWMDVT